MNDRVSRLLFLSNYLSNARNTQETVLEVSKIPDKPIISARKYLDYVVPTEDHLKKITENVSSYSGMQAMKQFSTKLFGKPKKNSDGKVSDSNSFKEQDVIDTREASSPGSGSPIWTFLSLSQKKVHP